MTTPVDLTGLSADQTVNDLCYEILRRAGKPMHYCDVASLLLQVKPFERGAPPTTLIDGDKLVGLLIEHELGVRKKSIEMLELDEQTLLSEGEETE